MRKISDVDHDELMKELDEVPGVKEFVESFPVRIAQQIIARRMDLRWTQEKLAKQVTILTGKPMTQKTISRVEGGSPGIKAETYDKILRALGMTGITIHFDDQSDADGQSEVQINSMF
jgi:transcriptional regulator with XRE-family HTH domain